MASKHLTGPVGVTRWFEVESEAAPPGRIRDAGRRIGGRPLPCSRSRRDAGREPNLRRRPPLPLAVLGFVLLVVVPVPTALAAEDDPPRYVRSLLEIRENRVVVQEWDLSCGAAALATVLTYQHGDPVLERDIARALIKREEYLTNPALVRVRQGFSLLDLQRYVDARGYEGVPLGKMTYQDLLERAPMIVPINMYGYNHFVVFRGAVGNRVLLADPSFGNRTLAIEIFQAAWIEYPEFGHAGFLVKRRDGLPPLNQLAPRPSDFVTLG